MVWTCISLLFNDTEYFLICLLAMLMSSFNKCLVRAVAYCFIELFVVCYLLFKYMMDINTFWVDNLIFFLFCGLSFFSAYFFFAV